MRQGSAGGGKAALAGYPTLAQLRLWTCEHSLGKWRSLQSLMAPVQTAQALLHSPWCPGCRTEKRPAWLLGFRSCLGQGNKCAGPARKLWLRWGPIPCCAAPHPDRPWLWSPQGSWMRAIRLNTVQSMPGQPASPPGLAACSPAACWAAAALAARAKAAFLHTRCQCAPNHAAHR